LRHELAHSLHAMQLYVTKISAPSSLKPLPLCPHSVPKTRTQHYTMPPKGTIKKGGKPPTRPTKQILRKIMESQVSSNGDAGATMKKRDRLDPGDEGLDLGDDVFDFEQESYALEYVRLPTVIKIVGQTNPVTGTDQRATPCSTHQNCSRIYCTSLVSRLCCVRSYESTSTSTHR